MTQDYKDTLLRFLTGNLNIQSGANEPQFNQVYTTSSDINDYINTNIGSGWEVIDIIQGHESIYSIIYGNDRNKKGFIVILDESMTPIQLITQFSSGTAFSEFQILNVDEDGKLYGIDIKNSTPRFIMLNNIVLKTPSQSEFIVKLRQSYNLPSPLSTCDSYFAITKAVGQGKYLIGGEYTNQNLPFMLITELTINVGMENEWVNYDNAYTGKGKTLWASWNGDVLSFKAGAINQSDLYYIEYRYLNQEEENWSVPIPLQHSGYDTYGANAIILNDTTTYLVVLENGSSNNLQNFYFYTIDYDNATCNQIEEIDKTWTFGVPSADWFENRINLKSVNGNVFFSVIIFERYSSISNNILDFGIIVGNNVYYTTGTSEDGDIDKYYLCVSNLYNLYTYYVIGLDQSAGLQDGDDFLTQQVYNKNDYNGLAYENTNSLIPNSGILYDNGNRIAFARDLYNKSVYNNTVLSVIQIPNIMVNDITITPKLLLGKTNKILTNNVDSFEKNIYETVYVNFYNTLDIENQNDIDNPIQNQTAAARLSMSTATAGDYDSAKATKYRVWYLDNTYEDFPVQAGINNGVATFIMDVYVKDYILKIDIMSADGATVYQTIDDIMEGGYVTLGKIYRITQDCHVE